MEKQILVLKSPVAGDALQFPWPLTAQNATDIIETMRWVLEDLTELKYALEYNVLQEYDMNCYESMQQLCKRFNNAIDIVVQIEKGTSLPAKRINIYPSVGLLNHILKQTYIQSVKNPGKLNQYQVFSPEVYGEISYELMHQIIKILNINKNDIFIDLGSGIGQVVLQIAAATDCRMSYGIEKEEIRSEYAKKMSENFCLWMNWYGKKWRPYELIRGDFLSPEHLNKIKSATIIFVNNFSFGPTVDNQLKEIFLELKNGTKIISSKNFFPLNLRITERTVNNLGAIAHIVELTNLEGSVSWTNNPVPFYLHIIDRLKLDNFFQSKQNFEMNLCSMDINLIKNNLPLTNANIDPVNSVQPYKLRKQPNIKIYYCSDDEVNDNLNKRRKKKPVKNVKKLTNIKKEEILAFNRMQIKSEHDYSSDNPSTSYYNIPKIANTGQIENQTIQVGTESDDLKKSVAEEINEIYNKNEDLRKIARQLQIEIFILEQESLRLSEKNCDNIIKKAENLLDMKK